MHSKLFLKSIWRGGSTLLCYFLMFSMMEQLSPSFFINSGGNKNNRFKENTKISLSAITEKAVAKEMTDKRTANSKTYESSDGLGYAIVTANSQNYQDKNGQWNAIDNNLIEGNFGDDFVYQNKANRYDVQFKKDSESSVLRLKQNNNQLDVSIIGSEKTKAEVTNNTIRYSNILKNIDIAYLVSEDIIKENIYVNDIPETNIITYLMKVSDGLKIKNNQNSGLTIINDKDEIVWRMPNPVTIGRTNGEPEWADFQLDKQSENEYKVSLDITPFLRGVEGHYPVIIDPPIIIPDQAGSAISNATVYEDNSSSIISETNPVIQVGRTTYRGEAQSFIKFSLPDIPNINSAVLAFASSEENPTITRVQAFSPMSDWSPDTIDWVNKPQVKSVESNFAGNIAFNWWNFDITSLYKSWLSGQPNNGIGLKAHNPTDSRRNFLSSYAFDHSGTPEEHASVFRPYIILNYGSDLDSQEKDNKLLGLQSWWRYVSTPVGDVSLNANISNGNLAATFSDLSVSGLGFDTIVSHTYNSKKNLDSRFGYNWTTSLDKRLLISSDRKKVIYSDETDTRFEFNDSDDNGNYVEGLLDPSSNYYKSQNHRPNGLNWGLKYDSVNHEFKAISNSKIIYTFDESGKILSEFDRNGNSLNYEYNGNQLTAIRNNDFNKKVRLYYDGDNRLKRIEDLNYQDFEYRSSGQKITYTYDNGDLKTISRYTGDNLVGTTTLNYLNHQLTSVIDAKNNFTTLTTVAGKVTEIIDALGKKTTISYEAPIDSQTGLTKVVSAKGNEIGANPADFTSSYYFSNNPYFHYGLVKKEVSVPLKTDLNPNPTAQTTEYDYNDDFKLTATVDPSGAYDAQSYDDISGMPVYQMDKQRIPISKNSYSFANYDTGDWRLIDSYNANGVQTIFNYDDKGNLIRKSVLDGDNINYLHNASYESVSRPGDANNDGKQDYDTVCKFAPSNQSWHWQDIGDYWCFGGQGDNKIYEIGSEYFDGQQSQVIGYAENTNQKSVNVYQTADDYIRMEPNTWYTLSFKYKQTDNVVLEPGLFHYNDHDQNSSFIPFSRPSYSEGWATATYSFQTPLTVSGPNTYQYYTSEIYMRILPSTTGIISGKAWFDSVKLQKGTVADQQVEKSSNYEFNSTGQVIKERTPEGKETFYEWDNADNLLSIKDPLQNVISFTYDPNGNKLSKTEPKGNATPNDPNDYKTIFTYNGQGQITSVIDAKTGQKTAYTYDANGDLETSVTSNNLKTTYINDKVGRPVETINPYGFRSRVEYDAQGNPKGITDPNGKNSGATYDAADRVEKETDPNNIDTNYTYDKNDNIKFVSRETKTISYNYDQADRLTTESINGVQKSAYGYDNASNLISDSNVSGTVAQNYSLTDEITKVTVAGQNFTYHRNRNNQLTSLDKANGDTVSYEYNDNAQVNLMTHSRAGLEIKKYAYEYDANGNQTKNTQDGNKATSYEYDNLNQLVKTIFSDGSYNRYTYDKAGNLVEKYNSSSNSYIGYSYDGNRLISKGDSNGIVEYFGYDANGNITSRASGEAVNLLGHFNNNLQNTRDNQAGFIKDDPKIAPSYIIGQYGQALNLNGENYLTYSSSSNITKDKGTIEFWFSPNWDSDANQRTLFEYFADNNNYIRLKKTTDNKIQFNYVKDGKDYGTTTTNPVVWTKEIWFKLAVTWETPAVKIFVNDQKAGEKIYCRLTDLYCKNALKPINAFSQKIAFGADISGATPTDFADAGFDEIRVSGIPRSEAELIANYFAATEYALTRTTTYEYDSDDYLIKITKPDNIVISYTYDANKRLIKRSATGKEDVNYEYDGGQLVAEKNNAGNMINKYIYDAEGTLLYIEQGVNKYYPIYDGLGSIAMLRDQNGATQATFEYDEWGKLINKTGSANSNFLFASYLWDEDAQLYHLGARWYDPSLMRFVSADPYPGDLDDPLSLNEYVYGGNNPVNRVDPNGDRWHIPNPFRAITNFISDQFTRRGYGEAALYLSNTSRFWRTIMDHPYVAAAAIAVVATVVAVAVAPVVAAVPSAVTRAVGWATSLYVTQGHHIKPQYLGGDKNGAIVNLSIPKHQQITNAFRSIVHYGDDAKVFRALKNTNPKEWQKAVDMVTKKVYGKFPIKGFK